MSFKKLINFRTTQLAIQIQDYANEHCEGNFSLAVRQLVTKALKDLS